MLNRRNIRSKVMQELYSLFTSGARFLEGRPEDITPADVEKSVKRLQTNLENIYKLYLLLLDLPAEIRHKEVDLIRRRQKKFRKTPEDLHPDRHLADNRLLKYLSENKDLEKKLSHYRLDRVWRNEPELVRRLLDRIKASDIYRRYASVAQPDFETDKAFVMDMYKNIIAPDTGLHLFLEDREINWADDMAMANTMVLKTLDDWTEEEGAGKKLPALFKSDEDREFGKELLLRTYQNRHQLAEMVRPKVINWDFERVSNVDKILLLMGVAEMLYFPSIPPRVSINEYVEIAKEFSTPKSNKFINGILDRIYKELDARNQIHKIEKH